ncbi:hypothetical protein QR98_0076060 [Sarcoptes scabiei]|uniref:Uncharacterized protein n=1 Tax=Sarcoptes scabiei TaxID=52283 RepID=A0A132ADK6_SARSC|nr:hypothetical protein QR98_0076060 [Sarcoptes scabiei]
MCSALTQIPGTFYLHQLRFPRGYPKGNCLEEIHRIEKVVKNLHRNESDINQSIEYIQSSLEQSLFSSVILIIDRVAFEALKVGRL